MTVGPELENADSTPDGLTAEQRLASGTKSPNIFIEAGPGTGKTTVSAYRFGGQRFGTAARADSRAVVAVSFTRSATWNLWRRVQRTWGPSALAWPHRIVTLDTVMSDLLHDLLERGLVRWPNGHKALDVHDSWASFSGTVWTKASYRLSVSAGRVGIVKVFTDERGAHYPPNVVKRRLEEGICTHEDVRSILEQLLQNDRCADRVKARLASTVRALIVDEAFDANDLDIAVIESAIRAGVGVTLVGDPWQALYVFRGARPQAVLDLIQRNSVRTLPLTRSFRWDDRGQRALAERLRAGEPVTLPARTGGSAPGVDVVLALRWKPLWEAGDQVLPLAFHAFKGGSEEAAATLLLNHLTRNVFGEDATYLSDALTALAIADPDTPRRLEPGLQEVAELLRQPGKAALKAAYGRLVQVVGAVSTRYLRPAHHKHTDRLAGVADRVRHPGRPVPGLTTHQAKGREWDSVGVRLSPSERQALAGGLSVQVDAHRQLYVACTRARRITMEFS